MVLDVVLWSVCVLIKFLTSLPPDSLIDQAFQRISRLLKLVELDYRDKFLKQIILEWTKASSEGANVMCFNPEQCLQFFDETFLSFNLKPILFDLFNDVDGTIKYSLLNCLLNLISFNGWDYSRLSELDVINLWGCLISDASDERIADVSF